MWLRSLSTLIVPVIWLSLAGCPGGNGGLGEACSGHDSCDGRYQCVSNLCVPRCQRGPECGDGYACTADGLCVLATGQAGDSCKSETDCAPGLACGIDGTLPDGKTVVSTCIAHNQGRPAGSACDTDDQCSNRTCALGLCVDLCRETRDCISGAGCTSIPIVDNTVNPTTVGGTFDGCLPNRGSITWSIPMSSSVGTFQLPVPGAAKSATVVFQVSDDTQRVGAIRVEQPAWDANVDRPLEELLCPDEAPPPEGLNDDRLVYKLPCEPSGPMDTTCNPVNQRTDYFRNRVRHMPALGQSVLQIPTSPKTPLRPGRAYHITAKSFLPNGGNGSAIPKVTAIVKMDTAVNLDLNFHFLNLDDHPCDAAYGGVDLNAAVASTGDFFQAPRETRPANVPIGYRDELEEALAAGGIALNNVTYTDDRDHPDLDGLAREDVGDLLSLGKHATGIDVFFVRTMTPVGLYAFGPNPGPAGLRGTRESGIVISVDALCHFAANYDPENVDPTRTGSSPQKQLARLTAYMLARYLGLFHTVELEHVLEIAKGIPPAERAYSDWTDQVCETDASTSNLMFFSESSAQSLSLGQIDILTRNAVLR